MEATLPPGIDNRQSCSDRAHLNAPPGESCSSVVLLGTSDASRVHDLDRRTEVSAGS